MVYWLVKQEEQQIEIKISTEFFTDHQGEAADVLAAYRAACDSLGKLDAGIKLIINIENAEITSEFTEYLDKQLFFNEFESDHKALESVGISIAARNKVLPYYHVDVYARNFEPWSALMTTYVRTTELRFSLDTAGLFSYFSIDSDGEKKHRNEIKDCFIKMGKKGLEEFIKVVGKQIRSNKAVGLSTVTQKEFISIASQLEIIHNSGVQFTQLSLRGKDEEKVDVDTIVNFLKQHLSLSLFDLGGGENVEDFDRLIDAITDNKIQTFISILGLNDNQKNQLDNAVAKNRREANKEELKKRVGDASIEIQESTKAEYQVKKNGKGKKRAAKKNARIGLAVQHQHQQQQAIAVEQQQTVSQSRQQLIQRRAEQASASSWQNIDTGLADLIDRGKVFNCLSKVGCANKKEAQDIWDTLVGKSEAKAAIGQKITHTTRNAIAEVNRDKWQFQDGINLDNLPLGFYLSLQPEQKRTVLCYDPYHFVHNDNYSPLTISYGDRMSAYHLVGSVHQFVQLGAENQLSDDDFKNAKTKKPPYGNAKVEIKAQRESLLKLIKFEDVKIGENIEKSFTDLTSDFSHDNYAALTALFCEYGSYGVQFFLSKISSLKNRGLYESFKHFLNNSANYSEFVTAEALAAFTELEKLDKAQQAWWNSLIPQHFAKNQKVMLQDLLNGFLFFCKWLKDNSLELPQNCNLSGVKDMRVALDRLLYILQHTVDANEQLHNLSGLTLDNEGAYFAVRYENFCFVSAEMLFASEHLADKKVLSYSVSKQQLFAFANDVNATLESIQRYFYRFIGQQLYATEFDFYRDIIKKLTECTLNETHKAKLLPILAAATTGEKNYQIANERLLGELLAELIKCEPDKLDKIIAILTAWTRSNPAPSMRDIKQAIVNLNNYDVPKLEAYKEALATVEGNDKYAADEKAKLMAIVVCLSDVEKIDELFAAFSELKIAQQETFANLLTVLVKIDSNKLLPTSEKLQEIVASLKDKKVATQTEMQELLQRDLPYVVFNLDAETVAQDYSKQLVERIIPLVKEHGMSLGLDVDAVCKNLEDDDFGKRQTAIRELIAVVASKPIIGGACLKLLLNNFVSCYKQQLLTEINKLNLPDESKKAFEQFCDESLKKIETSGDVVANCNAFIGEYEKVHALIALLAQIKKRWPNEMEQVVSFLTDNKGYELEQKKSILEHITRLDHKHVYIATIFTIFGNANANGDKIVSGLSNLTQKKDLSVAQFKSLLSLLVKYANEATIETTLNQLCEIKEKFGDEVFNAMVRIMDKKYYNPLNVKLLLEKAGKKNVAMICEFLELFNEGTEKLAKVCGEIKDLENDRLVIILKIVARAGALEKEKEVDVIEELLTQLSGKKDDLLTNLASLYDVRPYPSATVLKDELAKEQFSPEAFMRNFECDPYGNRKQKTNEQFDTKQAVRVITEIRDLQTGKCLSYKQQQELCDNFLYINAIGHTHPLILNGKYKSVKDLSRQEIIGHANKCKQIITGEKEGGKNSARLEYLALLREVLYRTTGKFPKSTQILAVLNTFMHSGSVMSEINTGEGKSIITALTAAMLWVEGQSVDVCSADLVLAERDLKEFADFYHYFSIETALITAGSAKDTYRVGGINYSDAGDMSLYRSRAKSDGERLHSKGADKMRVSLIMDEADKHILDQRTLFNFSKNMDPMIDPDVNIYAWIYPLIMRFIETDEFTNEEASQDEDVANLRSYLMQNGDTQQKRQLDGIENSQLDKWLDSALAADSLNKPKKQLENQPDQELDYLIEQEEREIHGVKKQFSVARILIDGRPSKQSKWSHGVQQLLHAKLNGKLEQGKPQFLIEPELAYIDSKTAKNLVDHYHRKGGRIIGMTGTAGSEAERNDYAEKYGFSIFKIAPHCQSQRHDMKAVYERNRDAQVKKIAKKIKKFRKAEQPVLIICKDIPSANAIMKKLKGYFDNNNLQLVDGSDSDAEKNMLLAAKKNGKITVATPILGRGTDIIPENREGLFVITTFVDDKRNMGQINGRSGRQGQPGKTLAIYNLEEISEQSDEMQKRRLKQRFHKGMKRNAVTAALQHKIEQAKTNAREITEKEGNVKRKVIWLADKWVKHIRDNSKDNLVEALKYREQLIQELEEIWRELLDNNDLDNFENRAQLAWERAKSQYIALLSEEGVENLHEKLTQWIDKFPEAKKADSQRQSSESYQAHDVDSVYLQRQSSFEDGQLDNYKARALKSFGGELTLALIKKIEAQELFIYGDNLEKLKNNVNIKGNEFDVGCYIEKFLSICYQNMLIMDNKQLAAKWFLDMYNEFMLPLIKHVDEINDEGSKKAIRKAHVDYLNKIATSQNLAAKEYMRVLNTKICTELSSSENKAPDSSGQATSVASGQATSVAKRAVKKYLRFWYFKWIAKDRRGQAKALLSQIDKKKSSVELVKAINDEIELSYKNDDKINEERMRIRKRSSESRYRSMLMQVKSWVISVCDQKDLPELIKAELLHLNNAYTIPNNTFNEQSCESDILKGLPDSLGKVSRTITTQEDKYKRSELITAKNNLMMLAAQLPKKEASYTTISQALKPYGQAEKPEGGVKIDGYEYNRSGLSNETLIYYLFCKPDRVTLTQQVKQQPEVSELPSYQFEIAV